MSRLYKFFHPFLMHHSPILTKYIDCIKNRNYEIFLQIYKKIWEKSNAVRACDPIYALLPSFSTEKLLTNAKNRPVKKTGRKD